MNITTENELINWLLEPTDIGIRYLTMRDFLQTEPDIINTVRIAAHTEGPIAQVMKHMFKEGYWEKPGAGYYPKYTGTVWSIILLAQLGASIEVDERIAIACSYLLEHALTQDGHFTVNGLPSGTADCLQGNLCAALLDLGHSDPRLDKAFEWMARSVTGEGVAPLTDKRAHLRYYAGKCGSNFACGSNNKLPCAWGATKVMLAFGKLPRERRTKLINQAITTGINFDGEENNRGTVMHTPMEVPFFLTKVFKSYSLYIRFFKPTSIFSSVKVGFLEQPVNVNNKTVIKK